MKNWFSLKGDGDIHQLGKHADFESADLAAGVESIWIIDDETAQEWVTVLSGKGE